MYISKILEFRKDFRALVNVIFPFQSFCPGSYPSVLFCSRLLCCGISYDEC